MKTMQEILNVILENKGRVRYGITTQYMCDAISVGVDQGLITEEEQDFAYEEINNYIYGNWSLGGLLKHNNLPHDLEAKIALYSNWESRPILVDYPRTKDHE